MCTICEHKDLWSFLPGNQKHQYRTLILTLKLTTAVYSSWSEGSEDGAWAPRHAPMEHVHSAAQKTVADVRDSTEKVIKRTARRTQRLACRASSVRLGRTEPLLARPHAQTGLTAQQAQVNTCCQGVQGATPQGTSCHATSGWECRYNVQGHGFKPQFSTHMGKASEVKPCCRCLCVLRSLFFCCCFPCRQG